MEQKLSNAIMNSIQEDAMEQQIITTSHPFARLGGRQHIYDMMRGHHAISEHMLDALRYSTDPKYAILSKEAFKDFSKRMKAMKDTVPCRNWEFTVPHADIICPEEVTKHISRSNPLIILHYGTTVVCFVHSTLMHKAQILNDVPWKFVETHNAEHRLYALVTDNIKFQDVIIWARYIKKAPWGDKKKQETVQVIIPNI